MDDLTCGDSFSHIAWTDVSRVVERSLFFFLIYFNRYDAYIIPKRGFHQDSDTKPFKSIVRSKLGNKAMLYLNRTNPRTYLSFLYKKVHHKCTFYHLSGASTRSRV